MASLRHVLSCLAAATHRSGVGPTAAISKAHELFQLKK